MGLDALKISQMKHNDLISLIRIKSIDEYHLLLSNQPIESIDFYGEDWCHNKKDFFHLKSTYFKNLKEIVKMEMNCLM